MFTLYYAPDNASLIVRIALEELNLPYETRLVDRRMSAQKSPAYRALNPRGQIPVLDTDDGPIFETAAILLWLSERTGALAPAPGALAPAPGDADRGAFLAWLFAASNGLHADLGQLFHPDRFAGPGADAAAAHRHLTRDRVRAGLDRFDRLSGQGHAWFGAVTPSALDIYVAVMLRWLALYPAGDCSWFRLADWPALRALAARVEARPAVIRAGAAEGLGPTPFTVPHPPRPPEGSAT